MEVLYSSYPSYRSTAMIKHLFFAIVIAALICAAILFLSGQEVIPGFFAALAVLITLALCCAYPAIWRRSHRFMITSRGACVETGLLIRTNQREMSFRRIQIIDVHQNILERLILGTGDLHIDTAAGDDSPNLIVFFGIRHPQRVAGLLREGEDRIYSSPGQDEEYSPYAAPRPQSYQAPVQPSGPAPWDRSVDDDQRPPMPPS